jgi:hypothetical protein
MLGRVCSNNYDIPQVEHRPCIIALEAFELRLQLLYARWFELS